MRNVTKLVLAANRHFETELYLSVYVFMFFNFEPHFIENSFGEVFLSNFGHLTKSSSETKIRFSAAILKRNFLGIVLLIFGCFRCLLYTYGAINTGMKGPPSRPAAFLG